MEYLSIYYHDEVAYEWSDCESDLYWGEEGAIQISQKAEKELLEATFQLHNMCLEVVEDVVNDDNLL